MPRTKAKRTEAKRTTIPIDELEEWSRQITWYTDGPPEEAFIWDSKKGTTTPLPDEMWETQLSIPRGYKFAFLYYWDDRCRGQKEKTPERPIFTTRINSGTLREVLNRVYEELHRPIIVQSSPRVYPGDIKPGTKPGKNLDLDTTIEIYRHVGAFTVELRLPMATKFEENKLTIYDLQGDHTRFEGFSVYRERKLIWLFMGS